MSPSQDMTTILEDLAAGRIDSAEAARRIDALPAADRVAGDQDDAAESASQPDADTDSVSDEAQQDEAADGDTESGAAGADPDAWAASTDRPQQATHPRDSFLDDGPSAAEADAEPTKETIRRPTGSGGVEKLSVRAVGRRVRIVGEPSVATVSADGPHVLRRNGSVLEISSDGEFGASIDGFQLLRSTRSLDDFRSLGLGKELLLRVNPKLLVDIEVTAGSLSTEAVPRLGSVRVTAGGAKLIDVTEISDALIQAGQATVKAAIGAGRSRIRVESGSLNLQLADSSNVTIATESQLGKVIWGGAHAGFAGDEVVMGSGAGRLDVEVVMGHASVKAGTAESASSGAA